MGQRNPGIVHVSSERVHQLLFALSAGTVALPSTANPRDGRRLRAGAGPRELKRKLRIGITFRWPHQAGPQSGFSSGPALNFVTEAQLTSPKFIALKTLIRASSHDVI